MTIHNEEKLFPCSDSDKTFSLNIYLNVHAKIHNRVKPYTVYTRFGDILTSMTHPLFVFKYYLKPNYAPLRRTLNWHLNLVQATLYFARLDIPNHIFRNINPYFPLHLTTLLAVNAVNMVCPGRGSCMRPA